MRKSSVLMGLLFTCTFALSAEGPGAMWEEIDRLSARPPMGWNHWNKFGFEGANEQMVRETVDAMVSSGLRDAGYIYVNLDEIRIEKFPSGMKALGDYIHSRGMKFGYYTRPQGDPAMKAAEFAEWGVDYLKMDFTDQKATAALVAAVRGTRRPVFFSLCEWGKAQPWTWSPEPDVQSWRTTFDLIDQWDAPRNSDKGIGILTALDMTEPLASYAKPGRWNDMDMLVVGLRGKSRVGGPGCTDTEYRAHFGLWCLMAAPLLLGNDVRAMDDVTKDILLNREAIAINQDPLGKSATRIWPSRANVVVDDRRLTRSVDSQLEVYAKPLADGGWAIGILNRSDQVHDIRWAIPESVQGAWRIRNVWTKSDEAVADSKLVRRVEPHGLALLRLKKEFP